MSVALNVLFRSVVKYSEKFLQNCFFLLLFNVVLGFFDEKISSKNYGWKLWQKVDKNTLLSYSGTLELKNANAEKHKKSFFQLMRFSSYSFHFHCY